MSKLREATEKEVNIIKEYHLNPDNYFVVENDTNRKQLALVHKRKNRPYTIDLVKRRNKK